MITAMPESASPWGSARRLRMALVIRDAGHPLTPKEIAEAVGRDVSNVAAALDPLVEAGLLTRTPGPPRPPKQRGAWPKHRYGLTPRGTEALERRATDEHVGAEEQPAAPGRAEPSLSAIEAPQSASESLQTRVEPLHITDVSAAEDFRDAMTRRASSAHRARLAGDTRNAS